MKLLIGGEVFTWQRRGGISRIYSEVLPRVKALHPDWDLAMAVDGRLRSRMLDASVVRVENVPRVSIVRRPWRFWRHVSAAAGAWSARRYWRASPADLYHPTYFSDPPVACPKVCFVYDMIWELCPESFSRADRRALCCAKRRAVAAARLVLCISTRTRDDLVRLLGVPERKCRTVPLAGFLDGAAAVGGPPAPAPRPFLLYVGNYRLPYKNFAFLLETLQGVPGLRRTAALVVASPDEPTPAELARWREFAPDVELRFLAGCDDAQLAGLYDACAAFVMPSLYEGFGLPVVEALGRGAPVACARAGALSEAGGDAVRYFDPRSPASLAAALGDCLGEGRGPEAVQRRRAHARTFSWDRTAALVASAFEEAQQGGGGA